MTTDKDIQALLDRYMEGQTTLEEEAILAGYFKRNAHVKEEWKAYQELFRFISDMDKEHLQEPEKQAKSHKARLCILSALATAAVLLLLFTIWPKDREHISNGDNQQPMTAKITSDTAVTVKADTLPEKNRQPPATSKKHLRIHDMPKPPSSYMAQVTGEGLQEDTDKEINEKLQQMELQQIRIDRNIDLYLAHQNQMIAQMTEGEGTEITYE